MSVESNLEIYKIILGRKTFKDVIYEKNDIPVETPEGKRKRQIREDEEKQLKLF